MEKTVQYSPKNDEFTGTVSIKMKPYSERLKEIAALGLDKPDTAGVEASVAVLEMVGQRVASIDVTHVESGVKIESIDELGYYEEGAALINEIAQVCIKGISLGKPKS